VDSEQKWEMKGVRLKRIEAGTLTVERDQVLRTVYRVQNGGTGEAKVILRHPRQQGMRLGSAPEGTDDQVGKGQAMVPVRVPGGGEAKARIEELRAYPAVVDWMSDEAQEAVKGYLADARSDAKSVTALAKVWDLRESLRVSRQDRAHLDSERSILQEAADQTRQSLTSIARNKGGSVEELRSRLTAKLTELERKLSGLSTRLVELDLKTNELQVRFQDAVRELKIERPASEEG
jgi:hypothetical protein